MKVKFMAGPGMFAYIGRGLHLLDGQIADVDEETGEYLIKTFPKHFIADTMKESPPHDTLKRGSRRKKK